MKDLTRSPIESLFTKISDNLSDKIYNLPLNSPPSPNNITTLGLLAALFSIFTLREGQIILCILFALTGQYLDNLDGYYARKYKLDSKVGYYYDRMADNIKIMGLIFVFYILYEDKIKINHIIIFITISLLGNLNFALRIRLTELNSEKYHNYLKPWNYLGKLFGSKENIIKITRFTRYFDETSIFIYYLFAIAYFHYS